jgi:RNA polymerase-binding protein DksA
MVISYSELIDRLEQQRADILAELEEIAQRPRYKVGYGNHQADDASAAFDQAADLAIRQNAERLLSLVERALSRWDAGTYGYCEKCGEAIDHARLKAIPYASLCMECADRSAARH